MTPLHWLLDSSLVQRLGWTLLHSVWEDAALAVILATILLVLRRSRSQTRYLAACATLLAMIVLPVVTFSLIDTPSTTDTKLQAAQPLNVASAAEALSSKSRVAPASLAVDRSRGSVPQQGSESRRAMRLAGQSSLPAVQDSSPKIQPVWGVDVLSRSLPWLVLTWACGVLLLSLWNLAGWIGIRQLRQAATRPVGAEFERLLAPLMRQLSIRRPVRLLQSALAQTPLVIGILRPIILLPASVLNDLSISELEAILSHELAHIRRHDYLINLIQSLIETLLFYHPAVWWVSQRIRIERENCCDDLVLSLTRDRRTYARALAAVASVRVPALAPSASGGRLLHRLRRIAGVGETDSVGLSRWIAGATVILLCVGGALLATRSATAAHNDKHDMEAVQTDDVVHVRGRVLDPDGKPQPGARILAFGGAWETDHPLSESRSAADGEFEIAFRKSQFALKLGRWMNAGIAALVPGLPPVWAEWDQVDASGQLVLKVSRQDTPIEGRILDTEGRGIPDVRVRLMRVKAQAVDLTKLNASEVDESAIAKTQPPLLPGYATGVPTEVTTDKTGRFEIRGVGSDRTVSFDLSGPTIARSSIDVVTRDVPTASRQFQRYLKITETRYGAKFDYTAVPDRVVRGTVTDAATGQPMKGVTVEPSAWSEALRTVTDKQGRYEIHGLGKTKNLMLRVMPPGSEPYLVADAVVPDPSGYAPVTVDFKLDRGVWLTGKVTDLATGVPVVGARVQYRPYLSNPFAVRTPEFAHSHIPSPFVGYETDANGRYRMVGVAGPALVVVQWTHESYRAGAGAKDVKCPKDPRTGSYLTFDRGVLPQLVKALKDVDIPSGVQTTNIDFQLDPGITIHLRAVDADGRPVNQISVLGDRPGFPIERLSSATFDAVAFGSNEQRRISVWDARLRIGRVINIRPSDAPDHKLAIKLEPWSQVTGRLIGRDGQPVANARVENFDNSFFPGGTDAKGRFHLLLLPGTECTLRGIKGVSQFFTDAQNVAIRPGQTKDLGDIHMK